MIAQFHAVRPPEAKEINAGKICMEPVVHSR